MIRDALKREAVVMTRDDVKQDLLRVESDIAKRYEVHGRPELIQRIRSGELPETATVAKWLSLYSTLTHWVDDEPVQS